MAKQVTLLERIDSLLRALDLLGDEVSAPVLDDARRALAIAKERAVLDPDTVLIALVGATGSGKSSLFNALVGAELAVADVLRPTTSQPLAALHEGHDASALLDWLGVSRRTLLPAGARVPARAVLLDLPDIDSRSEENRTIARLLADRADMVLWVVDPQKYADDVIHSQWIAPLARSARATAMVLNQVDRLDADGRAAVVGHLRALLAQDGAPDVPVLPVSARTGEGIAPLGDVVDAVARTVAATAAKARGSLDAAAARVREDAGVPTTLAPLDARGLSRALTDAIADAAGFADLARDVADSTLHRANAALGWLPVKWISGLCSDPLRRRHLGSSGATSDHPGVPVLSVEPMSAAAAARAEAGLRRVADEIGAGRPAAWSAELRRIARGSANALDDLVDHAVSRTRLGERRDPAWWGASFTIQMLGWVCALVGVAWLTARWAAETYLLLPIPAPAWRGLPIPTWLLLGGVLLTLLVWAISRILVGVGARRARTRAYRALYESLAQDVERGVVEPLLAEDERQRIVVDALGLASGDRPRR
ncbi:GTPase [Actinomyces culturomici]|uniref:GTPase n=1 Tax=Actinomyces culturomici TaxID=1926276 RepID=UPI001357CB49|nr:GTPase [Actinomyces culturomici]